jgi:excisionase family DNA binding protein
MRRPNRRPDPRRVRKHRSYTIAELAVLLDVHRNTVRHWQKQGLPAMRTSAGILILAEDVHAFLGKRRQDAKASCAPGTMYCLGCRAPRRPPPDLVEVLATARGPANLRGICPACGALMHRRLGFGGPVAAGFPALAQASAPDTSR